MPDPVRIYLYPADRQKLDDWQRAHRRLEAFVEPEGVGGSLDTLAELAVRRAEQAEADRDRLAARVRELETAAPEELERFSTWVRRGDGIDREDAVDEIARAASNRARQLRAALGQQP